MSTEELLDDVRKKAQALAKIKNDLLESNMQLREKIARLESSSERSRNEIEEMKGRLKIVKMAKTLESVEEKGTDSKYRINQLVKEIDKCIAMLNS